MPSATVDHEPAVANRLLALAGFIILCELAGASGAVVTDASWYRALARPSWAPPGWLFGPVWITLYAAMGTAAWLVWRSRVPARRAALTWFAIQLALNAAWTPVFFGLRSIIGGLVMISALLAALLVTTAYYRRCSRVAAMLMVPYALWVAFALTLNAVIFALNRN